MAKKRKSDATSLDEADRTTYATFCGAANSLSQLYSQAMSQQKLAFRSGERHSLEKLYQWILWQQEQGSRVAGADILAYLQQKLDCGEDSSMSPRQLQNQQHSQPANFATSNLQNLPVGQGPVGSGPRSAQAEQSRNLVFSNALSSPVRQNLQPFQLTQGGGYYQNTLIAHNGTILNRDSNSVSLNDTAMDMHSDSPPHEPHQ